MNHYSLIWISTVYPKKYAHGFCFAVLCCGYTLTDFPISIRLTSLALWQSNDCPSASKATLMNMDKYFMWIHYERLHNHNKAKHNKTVCIFLGIYCRCVGSLMHRGHTSKALAMGLCPSCLCIWYQSFRVSWVRMYPYFTCLYTQSSMFCLHVVFVFTRVGQQLESAKCYLFYCTRQKINLMLCYVMLCRTIAGIS